jgi:hypothetical protein
VAGDEGALSTVTLMSIGERFARCIADKDADGLKALLRSDLDFRALTPGRPWEGTDANAIVDETILGTWFEPERKIVEVLKIDCDTVGELERVGYRFRVERPDGEFVIEQQAYIETDGDKIRWLRIMCTGFLPTSVS